MGAEQSRDKWSPEGDLRLLLEHSENQENDQSILSLGHLSRQKVSTAIKRSFRFAQKPAKCICTKYTKINSTADELCLRQLFSEKIWKMILKHSKNSTDLQNLSNASAYFRNILLPRRTEFLFPKVFEVLVHQYEQNPSECFDMLKYQELEQPKNRPEYLRPSEILWDFPGNFRLVCRAWNEAVQQYYGQLNEWQLKLKTDRKVRRRRIPMNHMIDITSHSWFTQHFREEVRNPFLHKSLTIANICADRELSGLQQAYEREAQVVLRKFGCHLNYINISLGNGSSSFSCLPEFLNELFVNKSANLLQNIKVLKFEHKLDSEHKVCIREYDKCSKFHKPMFCKFPNLQFLSVQNLPASIFNGLIELNHTTISQLEIESRMYPDQYNYFHVKLPNLNSLSIDLYSEAGIQNLEQYGGNWHLTKFHCVRRGLNYIKLSRILRMVCNNWSASLKDFYLELQNIDSQEEMWELSKSFAMHLPELERIAIKLSTGWCSLDFLLPFKKLKYIKIDSDAAKPWTKYSNEYRLFGRHEKVRFLGYEKTMFKSNVWKLFPKLESVVVQGNVFHRERK